jgi:arylsulfatase A-like enzyme
LSIQSFFKNNGYYTMSNGKIYQHVTDYENGWSEKPWRPNGEWWGWQAYLAEDSKKIIQEEIARGNAASGPFYKVENEPGKYHALPGFGLVSRGPAYEAPDVPENAYPDGLLADKVILDLQRLKNQSEPFFLAAGFLKPHLPFAAPKKYWDMYNRHQINLADNPFRPQGAPDDALHNWPELRAYAGIPANGPLDDDLARILIHGYYACVSYTDAQIGRILDELERLDLAENTIIVVCGDHGWNLGEHGLWCKHANFETSLHSPLIFSAPGYNGGQVSPALTEFVDVYPTLCDLAGIDSPSTLHGKSLAPLMRDPDQAWKDSVYSRYENGDSIKTDRYRYTEYVDDAGNFSARMLYDHKNDPHENINISERPENRELVFQLSKKLQTYI